MGVRFLLDVGARLMFLLQRAGGYAATRRPPLGGTKQKHIRGISSSRYSEKHFFFVRMRE